jgi:uncharacterized protein YgiM (DUF1202 family)
MRSYFSDALMTRISSNIALLLLFLIPSACSSGGAAAPTISSDSVLQTAQAKAELTRQATFQTPPPTPIPPTPTQPFQTPTITPTLTPTPGLPILTADYNAYVREGPDETYKHVDFLLEGQRAYVVGRFENTVTGTWYQIERIDEGKDGWVWSGAVTFNGDPASIPEVEPPPR